MYVRKIILSVLPLFLLAPAFALGADLGSLDAAQARRELVVLFQNSIEITAFLIGAILTLAGGYKFKLHADEGKIGWSMGMIYILVGVLMMNVSDSLSVMTNTFFKVDFCTMIDDSGKASSSCFSSELSGLTGELKQRVEKLSSNTTAQKFMENIETIVGIFQVIGFIYFLVGLYGLVEVANGSAEHGYGKPLITMIASALIVDIPHTATTFIDTLNKIGINF
ncbi:hypothetical protein QK362_12740 [Pseudomonas aeruginosa]|nr:hypothetical protein [Pseudomonas aeruginosa]